MDVRIDKYLWAVRLTKTRAKAVALIKKNKVLINDVLVKPSKCITVGEKISIKKSTAVFSYKIIALTEKRVGAKLVDVYLNDVTPKEELLKYKEFQLSQQSYNKYGTGKPSKKDRRAIDDFLKNK